MSNGRGPLYWGLSSLVGFGLAILFGILAGANGNNQAAYIGAAVVCGVLGVICGIVFLVVR